MKKGNTIRIRKVEGCLDDVVLLDRKIGVEFCEFQVSELCDNFFSFLSNANFTSLRVSKQSSDGGYLPEFNPTGMTLREILS
ncbi:hypothetical protein GR7B_00233 [Vibrio phage vB_VcorM_GR7B]|nr:hypothetical protein GR7B_00233 [Vibrio phage vB_VcorM_GR7B]